WLRNAGGAPARDGVSGRALPIRAEEAGKSLKMAIRRDGIRHGRCCIGRRLDPTRIASSARAHGACSPQWRTQGGHTKADRSVRGMRLGAQCMQSGEGVECSPRKRAVYRTDDGTTFEVVFAAEAEVPELWDSPRTGQEGRLVGDDGELVEQETVESKAPRTHWDMLLERRTRAELEEILQERLEYLRARRGDAKSSKSA